MGTLAHEGSESSPLRFDRGATYADAAAHGTIQPAHGHLARSAGLVPEPPWPPACERDLPGTVLDVAFLGRRGSSICGKPVAERGRNRPQTPARVGHPTAGLQQ